MSTLTSGQPIVKRTDTSKKGPMPLVAPLFVQDTNTESEITMVNNSSKALNVEIMLTSLSGAPVAKTTVEMEPYGQNVQQLADLLRTVPPGLTATLGSVLLMPNRNASLAAQLSILSRGPDRTNDIEEEFAMMMDPKPAEYRAVIGNISGIPAVAIRSMSSTVQTISVTCVKEKGTSHISDDLQIAPNQMLLIQACAVFGIGMRGEGPKRVPVAMPFWDNNTLRSATAVYPGVTAEYSAYKDRGFRVQITLANFGNSAQSATVWLMNGTGAGSIQQAIVKTTVPPERISIIESGEIPPDPLGGNSIVIRADGRPGEVLSGIQRLPASATEQTYTALPWKDQAQRIGGRNC